MKRRANFSCIDVREIVSDGGEMLIAIVLDKPPADAKALVDDPAAFTQEMTRILLEKRSHPLIAQMIKPAGSNDPPPSNSAASSSGSHEHHSAGVNGQRGVPTVATYDVVTTVQIQVLSPWGTHG